MFVCIVVGAGHVCLTYHLGRTIHYFNQCLRGNCLIWLIACEPAASEQYARDSARTTQSFAKVFLSSELEKQYILEVAVWLAGINNSEPTATLIVL